MTTAMKLVWKNTGVQFLIIGEKTVPIEKFHNIFNVRDELDRTKYRALPYSATNCKMAAAIVSRDRSLRPIIDTTGMRPTQRQQHRSGPLGWTSGNHGRGVVIVVGKRVVDFLLAVIEHFSLALMVETS